MHLVGQVIRTSDIEKNRGRHQAWMDYVDYFDREGRIEANFSQSIKPYITMLAKRFTTIEIEHVAKFRRFYAIRIYELLMQYRKTGWRNIKIEDFRDILQIQKGQYPRFAELRRRVIEPAVKEINDKSEYLVEWEKVMDGRTVKGLAFKFSEKQQMELSLNS